MHWDRKYIKWLDVCKFSEDHIFQLWGAGLCGLSVLISHWDVTIGSCPDDFEKTEDGWECQICSWPLCKSLKRQFLLSNEMFAQTRRFGTPNQQSPQRSMEICTVWWCTMYHLFHEVSSIPCKCKGLEGARYSEIEARKSSEKEKLWKNFEKPRIGKQKFNEDFKRKMSKNPRIHVANEPRTGRPLGWKGSGREFKIFIETPWRSTSSFLKKRKRMAFLRWKKISEPGRWVQNRNR